MALEEYDDSEDPAAQLSFTDPSFQELDSGYCPTCQSRDRLLAWCPFPRHGGDGQAYQKVCRCHLPGRCYVHNSWNFKVD